VLTRRTGGHPLFLTTIIDDLIGGGRLAGAASHHTIVADPVAVTKVIPASIRKFIEHRFDRLSKDEQTVLEAASVAGYQFSIAAVVGATSLSQEEIEAHCARWTREHQFLSADGIASWPDGTLATQCRFRHSLFQEVVYELISPERRAFLHHTIGKRLESAYSGRAAAVASELAMHFEQGRDFRKAVFYLAQAARNSLQRSAYSEAREHLARAKQLLYRLPEGRRRERLELELFLLDGNVLMTTSGWGVDEVDRVFRRARELSDKLGDRPSLLRAIWGLISVSIVRAQLKETQSLARLALDVANKQQDSLFRMAGLMELGGTSLALGQPDVACKHFREASQLYDSRHHQLHIARFGVNLGMFSDIWEAHALWQAGYPDQAHTKAEVTLRRAQELAHPFTAAVTLAYAGMLSQFERDVQRVQLLARQTISHSKEHLFPYYLAWAEVLAGWSDAVQGAADGIGQIQRSIDVLQATAGMRLPYYRTLLAEACGRNGMIDEALHALDVAFNEGEETEERWWQPELHRIRGELFRSEPFVREHEAERSFKKAIDEARLQQAKLLELRASVSLGRLWRDRGNLVEAQELIGEVYKWFTEGFETADLTVARSFFE
jgi:predicted ATPase